MSNLRGGLAFVRRVRITRIILILKTSSRLMLQPHMKPKSTGADVRAHGF